MTEEFEQVESAHIRDDLLDSENRSRAWLEKSPVCTKVLDLDFNLLYMSCAGVNALKIDDVTAFYGKPYPLDFFPDAYSSRMLRNLKKAVATRGVVSQEGAIADTVGGELWFDATIVPVADERGELEYLIVISIDANERKKLEKELQRSHALFSQAEQMGKMGHWEWDVPTERLVACSDQYAAIFDMSQEEVMRRNNEISEGKLEEALEFFESDVVAFIHEDDRERYKKVTEAAYENKEAWDIEYRIISRENRVVHVLELGEPVLDEQGGLIRTFGTLQDITERKETEQQLNYQANHDALTGLINRREFEERTQRLLSTIGKNNSEHALCFIDLDQFKIVNDTCGHAAGDEMLHQLGSVLTNTVRHRDTLARLGGDEFGLLMEHCSLDDAHRVVESILQAINSYQFSWQGKVFKVSASIGLTPITEATSSVTSLLQDADAACYVAKDEGRNRIHVHHPGDEEMARRHGEMQWVARLNQALEKDQFLLYAQAIKPLNGDSSKHYELALRMIDETGGITLPGAFLPAAERYSMVSRLDRWVIEQSFEALVSHPAFLRRIDFISINLSGPSLADDPFLEFVIEQLHESGVDAQKICFEITETAAISHLNKAITFISTLHEFGCRFALDDFGSGLSSFAYLKNLPVDFLKIDGMFVRGIVDDPIDHAMVKSINEIGQTMGMQTIAEFVENDEIMGMLVKLGVDYAQGYGIGKPRPFDEILLE
jgi:diguanylate cyclase (GGDEF)-like protein/PAS domain S-box-containing protein